jgi:hypothetical protein
MKEGAYQSTRGFLILFSMTSPSRSFGSNSPIETGNLLVVRRRRSFPVVLPLQCQSWYYCADNKVTDTLGVVSKTAAGSRRLQTAACVNSTDAPFLVLCTERIESKFLNPLIAGRCG